MKSKKAKTPKGVDLSKFYGAWKISDAELKEIQNELKRFWKTWKLDKSVEDWIKEETTNNKTTARTNTKIES